MSLDGQGVYALGDQLAQGIIHEPMLRHAGQAGEAATTNAHREMAAFPRAGMAGMQVAVVHHFQGLGLQRGMQRLLDLCGSDRHGQERLGGTSAA